jgi:hypothetical protein
VTGVAGDNGLRRRSSTAYAESNNGHPVCAGPRGHPAAVTGHSRSRRALSCRPLVAGGSWCYSTRARGPRVETGFVPSFMGRTPCSRHSDWPPSTLRRPRAVALQGRRQPVLSQHPGPGGGSAPIPGDVHRDRAIRGNCPESHGGSARSSGSGACRPLEHFRTHCLGARVSVRRRCRWRGTCPCGPPGGIRTVIRRTTVDDGARVRRCSVRSLGSAAGIECSTTAPRGTCRRTPAEACRTALHPCSASVSDLGR